MGKGQPKPDPLRYRACGCEDAEERAARELEKLARWATRAARQCDRKFLSESPSAASYRDVAIEARHRARKLREGAGRG